MWIRKHARSEAITIEQRGSAIQKQRPPDADAYCMPGIRHGVLHRDWWAWTLIRKCLIGRFGICSRPMNQDFLLQTTNQFPEADRKATESLSSTRLLTLKAAFWPSPGFFRGRISSGHNLQTQIPKLARQVLPDPEESLRWCRKASHLALRWEQPILRT